MKNLLKNILKSKKGSALLNTMIAAAVVAGGALIVAKTGEQRGDMYLDINQNTLIENTILDMKVALALEDTCKAALDSGFTNIAGYTVGKELGFDVEIESIVDQNPGARDRSILILFKKYRSNSRDAQEVASRRPDKLLIQTFEKPDPADPTGATIIKTCTSYETAGVDSGLQSFCKSVGGTFDAVTGRCQTNFDENSPFILDFKKAACEAVGGTYNGNTCSGVNISGNMLANHFALNNINLGGVSRTDTQSNSCAVNQVGSQITSTGSLICKNISCPKPTGVGASNYSPRVVGGQLYCECQRDRGTEISCGQVDTNACSDYVVPDGCGFTGTCVIKRKPRVCPARPACDPDSAQVVYSTEGCNDYCFTVAACPAPPVVTPPVVTPPVVTPPVVTIPKTSVCVEGSVKPNPSLANGSCCLQRSGLRGCTEPGTGQDVCIGNKWVPRCGI